MRADETCRHANICRNDASKYNRYGEIEKQCEIPKVWPQKNIDDFTDKNYASKFKDAIIIKTVNLYIFDLVNEGQGHRFRWK